MDEEADYVPHPAAKKIATKVSRTAQVKVQKHEKIMTAVTVKTKTKRLNGNNVRMSDLPEFAQGQWRESFLPTLYDKFFTSDQPFDGFYKGSDQFIALLQTTVNKVFLDINYDVTSLDSIHFLVCRFAFYIITLDPHCFSMPGI